MGEIEFKGELHTIPAGADLVLKVDRILSNQQAETLKRYAQQALPGRRVLVIGPELELLALPVVSMGMDTASGPDMTAVALVDGGKVAASAASAAVVPGEDLMAAARALVKRHGGGSGG